MFSKVTRTVARTGVRNYKVAVLGASGGIGQPLSLLLKLDPQITDLSLFDVVKTTGVAADISHCCTKAKVIIMIFIRLEFQISLQSNPVNAILQSKV